MHAIAARAALAGLLILRELGLGPHVRPEPTSADIAQFWAAPVDAAHMNLLEGATGKDVHSPDTRQPFQFLSRKTTGFSPGYDVRDASGREWSVKLGPEAQSEVVVSRLLWAIGYHQPPTYYVEKWTLDGGPEPGVQAGGRFRPKDSLKSEGEWSWQHNPFVDSQPYRGLIVAMTLFNSTDLRNQNNTVYEVDTSDGDRNRWYVVKDLGATLGETGIYRPVRNDVDAFEDEPLFAVDSHDHARFVYHGLQKELLSEVTAEDLRWAATQFNRLSTRQWHDAFDAAGYPDAVATRYITAIRARLHEATTVDTHFDGRRSDYWGNRHMPQVVHALEVVPRGIAAAFKSLD